MKRYQNHHHFTVYLLGLVYTPLFRFDSENSKLALLSKFGRIIDIAEQFQ